MSKYKLTVHCGFCSNSHNQEIEIPDGWASRYGGVDDEQGFCPDHSIIARFAEDQCPGCVFSWGNCSMWDSFVHSRRRTVTEEDLLVIEKGVCPKRTNGTFGFSSGEFNEIDLSKHSDVESGKAFAQAIREYCKKYPAE